MAPDVYVVFGASGNHRRHSWIVWREGKAPDFVLEVASPRTWRRDAGDKRDTYAAMGVTEYWRFDPRGEFFVPELVGERLVEGEYRPLPLHTDEDGTLRGHSALLGLDICVRPGLELRLYDPAAGQWLLAPEESYAAYQTAEAARQTAETARQSAEVALRDAEEENQRLREQLRSTPVRPVTHGVAGASKDSGAHDRAPLNVESIRTWRSLIAVEEVQDPQ